jgi:hypothetical protein
VSRADRAESAVQALLTVAVGGVAGAAAWSHVVALATAHGQSGWLAWADAAVIETLAVAAGLEIRRRRRAVQPVAAVVAVLVAAVVLSLACQVATAEPSPWGWVMAAVPAVGFLCMAKIALGRPAKQANDGEGGAGEAEQARHGRGDGAGVDPGPDADQRRGAGAAEPGRQPAQPAAQPDRGPAPAGQRAAGSQAAAVLAGWQVREVGAEVEPFDDGAELPDANAHALLLAGVEVLTSLECRGVALTRNSLAEGLRRRDVRLSTDRATELLRQLRGLSAADRDRLHNTVSAEWEVAR